jgi:hypothetical protein
MGTPTSYTGHPDWIQTSSTPIPVLAAEIGTFAPGTFGPVDIFPPSGGAYMIAVNSAIAADFTITDLQVQHYDFANNLVFTDFFGAVIAGGQQAGLTSFTGPTIVRGNIYGSHLKVSGQVATSAFVRAISTSATQTAANAILNMYVLPNGIGDPDPKLSNGSASILSGTALTPGNLIQFWEAAVIVNGTPETEICVPYSGPATLNYECAGAAAVPSDFLIQLQFYTVAGGNTPFLVVPIIPAAVNVSYEEDINMPACLCTIKLTNNNAANAETFNVALIGAKSA